VIVAAVAGCLSVVPWMAHLALDLNLAAMVEREAMRHQLCWRPGQGCVTVLALQAEETGVDFWLSMALDAFRFCACKFLLQVAGGTFDVSMSTFEWKKTGMIEIAHAVSAIMALQACIAKLFAVPLEETHSLLAAGMAVYAGLQIHNLQTKFMAIKTGHRLVLVVNPVTSQAEAGEFCVFEGFALQRGWHPTGRGMAFAACSWEETLMCFGLHMTLSALPGSIPEWIAHLLIAIFQEGHLGKNHPLRLG
jgi:hypothetical protein